MVALAPRIPKTRALATALPARSHVRRPLPLAADPHRAKGHFWRDLASGTVQGAKYGVPVADLDPAKVYTDYLTFDREQTWSYDGVGNRKDMVDATTGGGTDTFEYNRPAGGGAYTPDSVNRIYRIRKNGVDTSRVHDANGNVTNDGTYTFKYNYKNEMLEADIISTGLPVQQQNFNSSGQRIYREASPPVYMVGVWMLGHPAEDIDGTGATLASYVVAAGQLLSSDIGGVPHYCLANQDESVAAWTAHGTAGTIEETAVYTAFGDPMYAFFPPPIASTNESKIARNAFRLAEWDLPSASYSVGDRAYEPATTATFFTRAAMNALMNPYVMLVNPPLSLGTRLLRGLLFPSFRVPVVFFANKDTYCCSCNIWFGQFDTINFNVRPRPGVPGRQETWVSGSYTVDVLGPSELCQPAIVVETSSYKPAAPPGAAWQKQPGRAIPQNAGQTMYPYNLMIPDPAAHGTVFIAVLVTAADGAWCDVATEFGF